jgi:2-polyprenyl-3-methyl-5-hydroxy-6-metoxy-1,4-benzoquinol methylase
VIEEVRYADKVERWQERPEWQEEVFAVLGHLGIEPGMRVLDFGAASGRTMGILQGMGCEVTGIEPSAVLRIRHERKETGAVMYRSLEEMIICNPMVMFDRVIAAHVLGHVEDPQSEVSRMYWTLRGGGRLAIVVPNVVYDRLMIPMNLVTGYRSDPTIRRELSLHSLKQMFPRADAERAEVFYLGEKPSWLPGRLLGEDKRSRLGVILTKRSL